MSLKQESMSLDTRLFGASEVLMLMLDCGTTAAQLIGEVPGFRMQAEFILSSKDDDKAKRLAFHSLLLNVASGILAKYVKEKDEQNEPNADKPQEPVDSKEQEDSEHGETSED